MGVFKRWENLFREIAEDQAAIDVLFPPETEEKNVVSRWLYHSGKHRMPYSVAKEIHARRPGANVR